MDLPRKWRFAIGATSRVPDLGGGVHYLIADFDNEIPHNSMDFLLSYSKNIIIQKTQHGWHVYTDMKGSFEQVCKWLGLIGADQTWIEIAKQRGYFFLADKYRLTFPWPVEHMVIYYGKEKTSDPS